MQITSELTGNIWYVQNWGVYYPPFFCAHDRYGGCYRFRPSRSPKGLFVGYRTKVG